MKIPWILFGLLGCISIWGQTVHKSPEEIQRELDEAEKQLRRAEEMFDPWYTGPLVTPSASMMPPGYANTQGYLFFTQDYAAFNKDRKSVSLANDTYNLNPYNNLQIGITDSVDTNLVLQTQTNWSKGDSAGGFGDLQTNIGFKIQDEKLYVPKMKFSIQETFPTGSYQHLRPDGLDATGKGAYTTSFSVAITKIMFWSTPHPINTRLAMAYKISTPVKVHGFNSYGGGYGTHGTVHPGNQFTADLGIEVSFDQHWVLANDFVYVATNKTKFHGYPGITSTGTPATVGSGFSDNFSLAPAIEYNWSSNFGMLAGVQFSVYGRNSTNFISTIISITYGFPLGPWKKS
ncbi:MAG: hypothetical protein K2X08_01860 [Chlamydiales bacterium]|nr:hypothetical protein [Chlamydiales bacterium]